MQEQNSIEVGQICARHQIEVKKLAAITGSFDKRIFFINDKLLLRVSETSMAAEQAKFRRVAGLDLVPRVLHTGVLECEPDPLFYTLLTLLPGDDSVNVYTDTSVAQQRQLGKEIAQFLDSLHCLIGTAYDIGLYVPAIPDFMGSWRAGHEQYWTLLKTAAAGLGLQPETNRIFDQAFHFLEDSAAALDYQAGPKLLHNDFHPKNILLDGGRFSGVIDWECSQYGEGDFDLCHLIHWCLYPPRLDIDFRPFLGGLLDASPTCAQAPGLVTRLTIYQIEHEIQQIVWHSSAAEAERAPRILHWMDGSVNDILRQV